MGGLNSGRHGVIWDRDKPIVEDSSTLSIFAWQRLGVLIPGTSGIYRFDGNSLSYRTSASGDTVTVEYKSGGQVIRESITIGSIPLSWHNGTSRRCFICPGCERRSYKLYITHNHLRPLCRLCNNMVYEQQTHNSGGLIYMFLQGVKRERKYTIRSKSRGK